MNLNSMFKIYMNLGENKITHMGHYSYSIQFDTMMGEGLRQAKAGQGSDLDDAFAKIRESI